MLQKYDRRNKKLKVFVNGSVVSRERAKVSVFDSVVQGGDAVWEGLRLYEEGILWLDRHLDRLVDSAHALAFKKVPSKAEIRTALRKTFKANGMTKDVHIRLTLTRGEKITSGMDPRLNKFGCGLIVLAEWKPPVYDNRGGIKVITSTIRRNSPLFLDSKIHHNNLLNNIQAKIQANVAGVDAALMLDKDGFAAELNGTNIFAVSKDRVLTPFATACLPGITRGYVLELAEKHGIPAVEANLSLTDLYTADELFCTGTMGELTPIVELDGRKIGRGRNKLFRKLEKLFEKELRGHCIMP
ncbi:MAG: aminotransferase IV [Saprospiraceae bacterium]|nr:aminotransferase IV [Saprospiraceae bacterium]